MRRVIISLTVLLAALFLSNLSSYAQEPQKPGKEHEELAKMEGTWDAIVKMSDGSESKAVAEYKMACEGMWLASSFVGEIGGQKFSGRGLDGYDPVKKEYTAVWCDSMTATPLMMTGTKDASGKVLTMTGDGGGMKFKAVTTEVSADKQIFKMSMDMPTGEVEMMTITYTRRKK